LHEFHRDFSEWGKITHIELIDFWDEDQGDNPDYTINISIDTDGCGYTITGRNNAGPYTGNVYVSIKITYELKRSNLQILDDGSLFASAANITGTIKAKSGTIGDWTLDIVAIPTSASTPETAYALYSDTLTGKTANGYTCTYQVYLTAKGVYVAGRYNTSNETGIPYHENKTWLEILES
jgi:hypothetical protein